jgi:hypothetical protein
MGYATTRSLERVAAAMGELNGVVSSFLCKRFSLLWTLSP